MRHHPSKSVFHAKRLRQKGTSENERFWNYAPCRQPGTFRSAERTAPSAADRMQRLSADLHRRREDHHSEGTVQLRTLRTHRRPDRFQRQEGLQVLCKSHQGLSLSNSPQSWAEKDIAGIVRRIFLPGNSRNCVISRLFSKKSEKIEKRG